MDIDREALAAEFVADCSGWMMLKPASADCCDCSLASTVSILANCCSRRARLAARITSV